MSFFTSKDIIFKEKKERELNLKESFIRGCEDTPSQSRINAEKNTLCKGGNLSVVSTSQLLFGEMSKEDRQDSDIANFYENVRLKPDILGTALNCLMKKKEELWEVFVKLMKAFALSVIFGNLVKSEHGEFFVFFIDVKFFGLLKKESDHEELGKPYSFLGVVNKNGFINGKQNLQALFGNKLPGSELTRCIFLQRDHILKERFFRCSDPFKTVFLDRWEKCYYLPHAEDSFNFLCKKKNDKTTDEMKKKIGGIKNMLENKTSVPESAFKRYEECFLQFIQKQLLPTGLKADNFDICFYQGKLNLFLRLGEVALPLELNKNNDKIYARTIFTKKMADDNCKVSLEQIKKILKQLVCELHSPL